MLDQEQLAVLRTYSKGGAGTRDTIARLGFTDYADIIVALARYDLPFPKPDDTPELREHAQRAHEILGLLLRPAAPKRDKG